MARSTYRLFSVCALTALVAVVYGSLLAGQTTSTQQVMREKLVRAEALLADLVTSNWVALDRDSRALDAVVGKPGWDVLRSPEYIRQTGAFRDATQALIESAKDRDQRVALLAYNRLVTSCVECHRYVARARIAGGVVPPALAGLERAP